MYLKYKYKYLFSRVLKVQVQSTSLKSTWSTKYFSKKKSVYIP